MGIRYAECNRLDDVEPKADGEGHFEQRIWSSPSDVRVRYVFVCDIEYAKHWTSEHASGIPKLRVAGSSPVSRSNKFN